MLETSSRRFRIGFSFRPVSSLAFLATLLGGGVAAAQTAPTAPGFSLNRFDPSERGSDWFANESLDIHQTGRLGVGVVADYGFKPLVLYRSDATERTAIVRHQFFFHPGANLILFDHLRLSASVPIAAYQDGDPGSLHGQILNSTNRSAVGDARLGFDLRLVGEYQAPFILAIGARFHIPTGDQAAFTSDGAARIVPLLEAAGDISLFTYAVHAGVDVRTGGQVFAGAKIGTEVLFGVAAGVKVADKQLTIGPEVYGQTVVENDPSGQSQAFRGDSTSLEAILGGHYAVKGGLRLGLGAGPGFFRGFGEPEFRALASIEYLSEFRPAEPPPPPPPPPPSDRDGDGIIDTEDACPDTPGIKTDDPKTNGCPPPPPDRDGDGIIDSEDACPDVKGVKTNDPKTNGCPPDRDNDGIPDLEDACPDTPGAKSDDPKKNGCPPDRDGDGVLDPADACPDTPGKPDPDPKKNGCPAARIENGQIRIIEQVQFKTDSDKILPVSDTILNAVLRIMTDHPEVTKVSIEGHTDSKGSRPHNLDLSKRRAASVAHWLTVHGVDAKRLTSQGFGPDKPIDSNETDAGRQNNRRVEFHIIGQNGAIKDNTQIQNTADPTSTPGTTGASSSGAGATPAATKKPADKTDTKKPADKKPAEKTDTKPADKK